MRRIEVDIHEYMAAAEAEYRILDSKAEKYFYNQKVRKAYYYADGYDMDDSEMPHSAFLNFSDEEVERIKTLIVEAANEDRDCEPVTTWQEAEKRLSYQELCGRTNALGRLLGDRLEEVSLDARTIGWDERMYFYRFSVIEYDSATGRVKKPKPKDMLLTDEQYLTLLKMQVRDPKNFNFNKLVKEDVELAKVLLEQVPLAPCLILFDEVREDAELVQKC
jgi:hypothetical protein